MSIIYCEKHDRRWDSDKWEECPSCESSNCEGFAPGANPDRCEHCGARAEQHARGEKPQPSATPRTDAFCISNELGDLEPEEAFHLLLDHSNQLERKLAAARHDLERAVANHAADLSAVSATENSDMAKVVFDNLPYLENLILPRGHESPLLRTHPFPCAGHDFCLVHQAQKGADAIRAALDSATADNRVEREGKDG
jgi:hypothetical protein